MRIFSRIFAAARSAAEELTGLAADVRTARVAFRTALAGECEPAELPALPELPAPAQGETAPNRPPLTRRAAAAKG